MKELIESFREMKKAFYVACDSEEIYKDTRLKDFYNKVNKLFEEEIEKCKKEDIK